MSITAGVDLDGVVYNYVDALRDWIGISTGQDTSKLGEATQWNFYEHDWNMSFEEFCKHTDAGVDNGYIFAVGEPYPGVVEGMKAMREAGVKIHIVTDRGRAGKPGKAEQLTVDWLDANGIIYDEITLTSDKTAINTHMFIDDRPENFQALDEAGVEVYLRRQRWNQHLHAARAVETFTDYANKVVAKAQNT